MGNSYRLVVESDQDARRLAYLSKQEGRPVVKCWWWRAYGNGRLLGGTWANLTAEEAAEGARAFLRYYTSRRVKVEIVAV